MRYAKVSFLLSLSSGLLIKPIGNPVATEEADGWNDAFDSFDLTAESQPLFAPSEGGCCHILPSDSPMSFCTAFQQPLLLVITTDRRFAPGASSGKSSRTKKALILVHISCTTASSVCKLKIPTAKLLTVGELEANIPFVELI